MGLKKIKQFIEDVKDLGELPDDDILEKIADAYFEVLEAYAKKKPKNYKEFKKIMELQLEIEELAKNIIETWKEQLSIENNVELAIIAQGGDTGYKSVGQRIGVSRFIVKKAINDSRFETFFNLFIRTELRFRKSYMEKKKISRRVLTSSAKSAYSRLKKLNDASTFREVVKGAGIPKSGLCPTGVRHSAPVRTERLGDEKPPKKKRGIKRMLEGEKLPVEEVDALPIKAKGGISCPLCNLVTVSSGENHDSKGRLVRIYKCMNGHKSKELLE